MSQNSDTGSHPSAAVGPRSSSGLNFTLSGAPRIYLVAAVARNGVIGAHGKLPWHLPEDLQHFKKLTLGHPVIMGRRTWESLGKPLPGRENIVITRTRGLRGAGRERRGVARRGAIALCAGEPVAFVIGGAEIYAAALPLADGLVLTEIQQDFEGDTRFPAWDRGAWRASQREDAHLGRRCALRFRAVRTER